ncbi:MAG: hypothetical protein DRJ57_02465 [Thermoprotei archaeon]|mgnify:CR=1 FL=1|nr:MAG: hypothetical protein DRJ57_02465 [Thermoprotei archaeon]
MEHRKLFPIPIKEVVVRDWVRLKCKYGCGSYGKRLTCPPYSPTPEEMRRVLKEYEVGLLVKFGPSVIEGGAREGVNVHEVMFKLERAAFLRGYYPAFWLSVWPLHPVPRMQCEEGICRKPHMARPSMEACGIDVYAAVKNVGLELRVVASYDQRPTSASCC